MILEDSFGRWIQRHRKALDLTQQELAFQVGCAPDTLRKIETGARRPSQQIATRLAEALGVPPAERATFIRFARSTLPADQVAQFMREGTSALAPAAPASERVVGTSQHVQSANLPLPLTNLIGRRREIDELLQLLQRGKRLITLIGPGGVGKTRLTLQLGSLLAAEYQNSLWFIDASSVRDTRGLINRVAETLGVAPSPEHSIDQRLQAWMAHKRLLVIVDNVEQVPQVAEPIGTWLRSAPNVVFLVTSRIPVDIAGEQQYPVKPLSLPNPQLLSSPLPSMLEVQQSEAVDLFAARVRDIQPHFEMTYANQADVAEICWRLDGLPLALELAAAHIRLFTPKQLLEQLRGHGMLRLLQGKPQNLPPRQQTIYATLAWSYNLLEPSEQTLLSRLAIFESSWTLSSTVLICVDEQDGSAQFGHSTIVSLLKRLVEHNLVQQVQNESIHSRFTLLEMVREFAWEQLELRGEVELMRRRHALAFFELATQAREQYDRGNVNAFSPIHADLHNFRMALAWALEHDMIEAATETIIQLTPFWSSRMPVALSWLEKILARAEELSPELRAHIYALVGSLSWELFRDPVHAQALCEASLSLYRKLQDHRGTAMVLAGMAHISILMGEIDALQVEAYLAESVALRRMLGDQAGIAETMSAQGRLAALYGDYPKAEALMLEALQIQRTLGKPLGIAVTLFYLGWLAFHEGKYVEMAAIHRERLLLEQAMGNPQGIADCALWLGLAAFWQDDIEQATQLLESSLQQLRALGDPWHLPHVLDACAHAATGRNELNAAQQYQLERVTQLRMLGAQRGLTWSYIHLVYLSLALADVPTALGYFQSALEIFREKRDPYGQLHLFTVLSPHRDAPILVPLIECAAALALRARVPERAIQLAGAATALRSSLHAPFYYPDQRAQVTATIDGAQALLSSDDFTHAWQSGQNLSLEQAVAEVFTIPAVFHP